MLSVKQEGIKHDFWVVGMTLTGIELIGEHSNHYAKGRISRYWSSGERVLDTADSQLDPSE